MGVAERVFPLDHPAAQGHFPGNPIIPGAVLLSETLRAIETDLAITLSPGELASATFLHPTRPGDRMKIAFSVSSPQGIKFTCSVEQTTVLTGMIRCGAVFTPA
jgi:3-hydroxymyristoyl/3-hydroxydecanoyl-(acyl carrier protein) dehydratase